jgi:hypothetical protein
MTRIEGWDAALYDYLETEPHKPFTWDQDNCVALAYGCIKALRGEFKPPMDASWTDEKAALRTLRNMKCKTLADAFAKHLDEIPPAMAGRGDIGIIDNGALICTGQFFVGRGVDGRVIRNLHEIQRAFRA